MLYIKNTKLVLETGILWDAILILDEDRIAGYGKASEVEIPKDAEVIDAGGLYTGPGFVDIHVHGGGGAMFTEEPEKAAKHFISHGETTILPTLQYQLSKEGFIDVIRMIKKMKQTTAAGQAVGGLYMEGPYMNPKYGASANENKWRGDICAEDYKDLVDEAGDMAKIWAIAPERDGVEPFMAYAKKQNPNTIFAIGHSEATPKQIRRLKKYDIPLQTHCMNATGRVSTWGGTRSCGPDEYCMADSDMYAELICDSEGIHVSPDLIRMILKIKGLDKIILISDSFVTDNRPPEGLAHIKDLSFDSNGGLSGSRLTMELACKNMMTHTNCGIAQAFLMASRNPAKVIGMDDEIGTIEVGKRADLVLVDDAFGVNKVILRGKVWRQD